MPHDESMCMMNVSAPSPTRPQLPPLARHALLIIWDSVSWILALLAFLVVRYDFGLSPMQWNWVIAFTLIAVVLQCAAGLVTQVYLGRHRVGSFSDAGWTAVIVCVIALTIGLALSMVAPAFPRGVALTMPPLALVIMLAGRFLARNVAAGRPRAATEASVPAIVYGAGNAGHQVSQLMRQAEEPPYRIVGFLDDDKGKSRLRIHGLGVRGRGKDLAGVAAELGAEAVIYAISNADADHVEWVSRMCTEEGLDLVVVPPLREMVGGKVTLGSLRHLSVTDLLGRRPISTDISAISDYVSGKVVLVTGAGGSIGSELAVQLHRLGPAKLLLLDRDESALHGVQLDIYGNGLLDTDDIILCDIRDEQALQAVFEHHRPQVVFHAAALKHLPMLERFPLEGWRTNVLGTRNVLQAAHSVGVQRFVNISTDKAAAPTSVLGATKRLAERLTAWHATTYDLPYLSVRFGNVLGSRGSVLISFRNQIEKGGPVTVTHPDVTRYFMTIPEACELVLQAGAIGNPGEVLVLDMGQPVKILDVAKRMIAESGQNIDIHFTGLRPGEKMHEVLFSNAEAKATSQHPMISEVQVPDLDPVVVAELPSDRESILAMIDDEPSVGRADDAQTPGLDQSGARP
ncbi:polysaccharide biosynthesis protein [Micrococcus luteus]|nr:polysaccharide biosynthesis protein [Micrococcus luteus]